MYAFMNENSVAFFQGIEDAAVAMTALHRDVIERDILEDGDLLAALKTASEQQDIQTIASIGMDMGFALSPIRSIEDIEMAYGDRPEVIRVANGKPSFG